MTHGNTNRTFAATIFTAAAAAALLVGCQSDQPKKPAAQFFPGETGRSPENLMIVQARNGARQDAMLQPFHFDGEKLNTLGEAKLDLMLGDDVDATTTVYLNFPEDQMMNERRDDVVAYMKTRGVEETHLNFVSGANPATDNPAAAHLARLERTESTGEGDIATGGMKPAPMTDSGGGSNSASAK